MRQGAPTLHDCTEAAKTELQELMICLRKTVGKVVAADASFADREAATLAMTNEAVRQMLQAELQRLSDGFGERVRVDDVLYAEHEEGTVGYGDLEADGVSATGARGARVAGDEETRAAADLLLDGLEEVSLSPSS